MKKFITVSTKELSLLICDSCGLQASTEDIEFREFICTKHSCGYGSIHGDGNAMSIDLCQHCFLGMCGDMLTVERLPDLTECCEINTDIRRMLSANRITNEEELKSALSRVEQLWDAQYNSAEGNELHQLAELICRYENKNWDNYFHQKPVSDEFKPDSID